MIINPMPMHKELFQYPPKTGIEKAKSVVSPMMPIMPPMMPPMMPVLPMHKELFQ